MKSICTWALVLCLAVPVAHAEEKEASDDWYGQADFTIGMLQDLKTGEKEAYYSFPLGGYRAAQFCGGLVVDLDNPELPPTAAVFGVTFYIGNFKDWGIDAEWAKYFSVSVGPYARYGFESEEVTIGAMASLLEFSFGGTKEQRKR